MSWAWAVGEWDRAFQVYEEYLWISPSVALYFNVMPFLCRSCWKSHPYALGAYSFIPIGAYAEDIETLAEPVSDSNHKVNPGWRPFASVDWTWVLTSCFSISAAGLICWWSHPHYFLLELPWCPPEWTQGSSTLAWPLWWSQQRNGRCQWRHLRQKSCLFTCMKSRSRKFYPIFL